MGNGHLNITHLLSFPPPPHITVLLYLRPLLVFAYPSILLPHSRHQRQFLSSPHLYYPTLLFHWIPVIIASANCLRKCSSHNFLISGKSVSVTVLPLSLLVASFVFSRFGRVLHVPIFWVFHGDYQVCSFCCCFISLHICQVPLPSV